jgi:hypothetical protein
MSTDPSRFDRVEAHPEYEMAPEQPVLPADASIGIAAIVAPISMSLFGIVFLLIAIGLLVEIKPPLGFAIIFIAGALVFILGGIAAIGKLVAFRNAPIERLVAVIVKERTDVSGGGENREASTTYYATLQRRDGTRTEYRTYHSLVGRLAVGDIGVAYVKARTLVEFIRFDVA